jgi:hypothetical protein
MARHGMAGDRESRRGVLGEEEKTMAKVATKKTENVQIKPIKMKTVVVNIIGYNLIMHRFAKKAWQELIMPSQRQNSAGLAQSLKHDPMTEYRECFYMNHEEDAPTLFHLPRGMISKAMAAAALDIPGATKASIERLTSVATSTVYLYGTPQIRVDMVRNSDINRTPDVRTRPIFPRFAAPNVAIRYKADPLTDAQIINLVSASGDITGYGDARQQKGGFPEEGGPFGIFRLCDADDPELLEIVASEGREVQRRAWHQPQYNTATTADLLGWFYQELERREKDEAPGVATGPAIAAAAAKGRGRGAGRKRKGNGGSEAVAP